MDFKTKNIRLKDIINEFKMKRKPYFNWNQIRPENLKQCMGAYEIRLHGLWKRIDNAN